MKTILETEMTEDAIITHVPATVHGRCLVRRAEGDAPAPMLVGFHGYAENAETQLERMARIPGASRWLLCAVQALHPFYDRRGAIAASWMTSQDRERAIEDNTRYVGAVVTSLKEQFDVSGILVYIGFSQGTSMAWRAAMGSGHDCHGVIALGGDAPADVVGDEARADVVGEGARERAPGCANAPRVSTPAPMLPPTLLARGDADRFYPEEQLMSDQAALEAMGVAVTVCQFEGGHEWGDGFYQAAGGFLAAL